MEEIEYTSLRITKETKEEFDKQRNQTPFENSSSTDEFLNYLLQQNKKKTKQ